MHFGKTLIIKLFFFLPHVFMFSKQMTKCETVSFIRDCIFRNYPSQRRHRQHVNTNTIQKDNINGLWSWHLFVITLVLPALYLMLRYTAAPFFTTTWSMTTTMTQIQGQCHNIPRRIRFLTACSFGKVCFGTRMVSLLSGRDLDCLMLSRGILLEIQQYINLRFQMTLCCYKRLKSNWIEKRIKKTIFLEIKSF